MSDNLTESVWFIVCGRYSAVFTVEELRELFGLEQVEVDYPPRYNVAPTQKALTVLSSEGERLLSVMSFGFGHNGKLLLNARAETLIAKPTFDVLIKNRRCLIPADGFFEWGGEGKNKVPYRFILPDNRLFAFAGLWSEAKAGQGFVVITTEPCIEVAPIHNRMPVMLTTRQEFSLWLHADVGDAVNLLRPYREGLKSFEVSKYVSSPQNDGPECVLPLNKLW